MSKQEPPIDEDERQIVALFDRTAEEPSQQVLDRLARHAAQIPEKQPAGVLDWIRERWLAIGLAFATASVAAAALLLSGGPGTPERPSPIAERPTATASSDADPGGWLAELDDQGLDDLEAALEASEEDEPLVSVETGSDPLAALEPVQAGSHPLGLLELLFEPEDEEDFERWSAAVETTLEGG